ncbi:hypothetical protein [Allonocardiopsis opalescens]|uniref:Uncharacterized protein n=1 Tax=Allonocardiopsis opalescens TaxID=1144618 RepID=A0A2T0PQ20_9ACTN|nr:hypothetical protein [Allonocardiopsis opalescens]PRX90816.1 hypothetical protein CLV72_11612 [Allonocardiopsis opalescens]
MTEYTVESVTTAEPAPGHPCWRIRYRRADGEAHEHVFPADCLEWRMAEYGVDAAEALDMVLAEPFIPDPADPARVREDVAVAAGFYAPALVARPGVAVGDTMPSTLHTADSITEARAAHRLRVAAARQRVPLADPDKLLDQVLAESPTDPEVIAVMADHVTRARAHLRQAATPTTARTAPADRAAAYRRRLLGDQPREDHPRA